MKLLDPATEKIADDSMSVLRSYNLAGSYGLFRRMTGVNGRGELSMYGSDDGHTWKIYEFYHKPTKTDKIPTFIAPHQPRLDWQMWFSALSNSPTNRDAYLQMMIFRLLHGSESVQALLGTR